MNAIVESDTEVAFDTAIADKSFAPVRFRPSVQRKNVLWVTKHWHNAPGFDVSGQLVGDVHKFVRISDSRATNFIQQLSVTHVMARKTKFNAIVKILKVSRAWVELKVFFKLFHFQITCLFFKGITRGIKTRQTLSNFRVNDNCRDDI